MNRFSIKHITIAAAICSLLYLLILTSGLAIAKESEKPDLILPAGVLTALQIEQLFIGKTVAATIESKDRNLVFFFAEDGKVQRIRNGWQKSGRWKVRDDGRLCIDLKGSSRECRMIVKQGDQYRQYAVKKDGNHQYEITYNSFHKGKQLAKMSKKPILPEGTLTRKKIVKLFSGQTVESITAGKGRVSQTYYDPDGTLVQLRNGVTRSGKWRVRKDSRMCLEMEGYKEKCRIIVK